MSVAHAHVPRAMCTLSVFAAHHAQAALAERTIVVVSPCKADEVYCEPTIAGSSSSSRTGAGSCVARLMGCQVAQLLLQQPGNPSLVVRRPMISLVLLIGACVEQIPRYMRMWQGSGAKRRAEECWGEAYCRGPAAVSRRTSACTSSNVCSVQFYLEWSELVALMI